ncbi:MAG: ComF family protein, partial [Terracidiphilus sp.]
ARCGDTVDQSAIDRTPISEAGNEFGNEAGASGPLCRTCRLATPPFLRAVAYGPYTGRMREAIHALKYQKLHPASRRLGHMLAQTIAQLHSEAPGELLVVPVPLHPRKRRQRGFNQTTLLAEAAIRALRQSHPQWRLALASGVLVRKRATGSQAGLTPRQRRLNVRNAFRVPDSATVAGRHILVIDDILTTGATVRSASRALVAAGATSVRVATLARARRVYAESFNAAESREPMADAGGSDRAAGTAPAVGQVTPGTDDLFDGGQGCRWEKP